MQLDHLVVVAADLDTGAAAVEAALGTRPGPGGRHVTMGTHNCLLSLGAGRYLEVIAPDPAARAPERARWFGLDAVPAVPRLAHWAVACDDLRAVLGAAPVGMGDVLDFARGPLAWSMAVPQDGILPDDGVLPALLEWQGGRRAADMLPASDCTLQELELRHPDMARIRDDWPALGALDGILLTIAAEPSLTARIVTPRGVRTLSSVAGQT